MLFFRGVPPSIKPNPCWAEDPLSKIYTHSAFCIIKMSRIVGNETLELPNFRSLILPPVKHHLSSKDCVYLLISCYWERMWTLVFSLKTALN